MKDHELTAFLPSVLALGSIVHLHVHNTGPFLRDFTILSSLFQFFKVSMWIILDIGGDPNVMEQRTSKYLDTEAGFMGKKIRGMLCGGGPKNTNWITLVKAAVKLLKLPKSGVEILFNKTYVD